MTAKIHKRMIGLHRNFLAKIPIGWILIFSYGLICVTILIAYILFERDMQKGSDVASNVAKLVEENKNNVNIVFVNIIPLINNYSDLQKYVLQFRNGMNTAVIDSNYDFNELIGVERNLEKSIIAIEKFGKDILGFKHIQELIELEKIMHDIAEDALNGGHSEIVQLLQDSDDVLKKVEKNMFQSLHYLNQIIRDSNITSQKTADQSSRQANDQIAMSANHRDIAKMMFSILLTLVLLLWVAAQKIVYQRLNVIRNYTRKIVFGDYHAKMGYLSKDILGFVAQDVCQMSAKLSGLVEESRTQRDLAQKLRRESEAANEAKSQFLANMSHEIRTPLTAIIGFSETLLNNDSEDSKTTIRTIIRSGEHLLQLINDILDISKLEAGKINLENLSISVFDILDDISQLVEMKVYDKGLYFNINYHYPLPKEIKGDSVRLKQVLLNLVSNAIKFTQEGGVDVNVSLIRDESILVFEVKDTGIGITVENQSQLFSAFQQADSSTTRQYGGTGLGLHLSKALIEAMEGSIELKSVVGMGTIITIRIPIGVVRDSNLTNDKIVSNKIRSVREAVRLSGNVLLVEDNIDNQNLISLYIRKLGAKHTIASNGMEGVEKALTGNYDLVLMDMQMPILDGVQATRKLRKSGYCKPIVALTANVMREDKRKCIKAGCDSVLAKPIDIDDFNQVMMDHLVEVGANGGSQLCISKTLGQVEGFRPILEAYIKNLPAKIDELKKLLQAEDWEELAKESHKIKGSGGGYGFSKISSAAALLEEGAISNNIEICNNMVVELMEEANLATEFLFSKNYHNRSG